MSPIEHYMFGSSADKNMWLRVKRNRSVVVLIDTTYWERNFGVMLFKDAYTGENILKYYVKTETDGLYKKGICAFLETAYHI